MSVQKNSLDKKQSLSKQLYNSGHLWSYKAIGDHVVLPDEELILNGLSHLEFEDMPMLFAAFPYRQIKQVWRQRMLPYPDYYGTLNLLLAALFFHIKSPFTESFFRLFSSVCLTFIKRGSYQEELLD